MAGHSKWANIKHKKAAQDAKRGKAFTRLTKEITVAAKTGGGDPAGNARLRQLIEKARDINMPLDNINRAVKRGTGELPGVHYEAHTYEGYGPHGIAIMVETLSDNKNRTVAEMRNLFSKQGGNIADAGAVSWMFERLGVVRAHGKKMSEDELLELLIEFDIKNITTHEDTVEVTGEPKCLDAVKNALKNAGFTIGNADLEWVAKNTTELGEAEEEKAIAFLDAIEEHDDVQNVYTNLA
ncbi:MAG: YebC/PmpR family DNA-binding transcriptional regulator [Candidatus Babeliales bacterium]